MFEEEHKLWRLFFLCDTNQSCLQCSNDRNDHFYAVINFHNIVYTMYTSWHLNNICVEPGLLLREHFPIPAYIKAKRDSMKWENCQRIDAFQSLKRERFKSYTFFVWPSVQFNSLIKKIFFEFHLRVSKQKLKLIDASADVPS